MTDQIQKPKVFISYCWTDDKHSRWVEELGSQLETDTIEVVFDRWDLTHGQDKFVYMERMVNDPTITRVLIICNKEYAERADGRGEGKGTGVGTETSILTPEIYANATQTKFIPILRDRDENGKPCLPAYLKSRIYIDFCDDDRRGDAYDELLRNITNKPERKRPPRGKSLPAHLLQDEIPFVTAGPKLERLRNAVSKESRHVQTLLKDYLNDIIENLEKFRIKYVREDSEFDDKVVASISSFKGYRDSFVEFIGFAVGFMDDDQTYESIHEFFEELLPYKYRRTNEASYEWDYDNYRFIMYELLLYFLAILIKNKKHDVAARFIEGEYFYADGPGSNRKLSEGITAFYEPIGSFEKRARRHDEIPGKTITELMRERATKKISMFELFQVEILLTIRKYFPEPGACESWYPRLGYLDSELGPFPIVIRATTPKGIVPLQKLLKVKDLHEFYIRIIEFLASTDFRNIFQGIRSMHWGANELFNLNAIAAHLGINRG